MAKYSSDSESDRSGNKYRRKHSRKSSSIDSSDSSSSHQRRQKYSKSRRRYRSRSRSRDKDRSSKSYKHSKRSSRDRKRYRAQRSKSSSTDRNRSKKRSASREKSSSRSSSSQSNVKAFNAEKPSSTSKEFLINDLKIKSSVLDDINNDEFIPKQFVSSAKSKEPKMKNIVIDMNADVIHVPSMSNTSDTSNSVFHTSIMADKESKFDKWVKKLYSLRQKAVNELNYI